VELWSRKRFEGETCGIPHLAKNERDVGHPAFGAGIEPKSALVVAAETTAGPSTRFASVGMTRGEGLRFGRLATWMDRVTNGYIAGGGLVYLDGSD